MKSLSKFMTFCVHIFHQEQALLEERQREEQKREELRLQEEAERNRQKEAMERMEKEKEAERLKVGCLENSQQI